MSLIMIANQTLKLKKAIKSYIDQKKKNRVCFNGMTNQLASDFIVDSRFRG